MPFASLGSLNWEAQMRKTGLHLLPCTCCRWLLALTAKDPKKCDQNNEPNIIIKLMNLQWTFEPALTLLIFMGWWWQWSRLLWKYIHSFSMPVGKSELLTVSGMWVQVNLVVELKWLTFYLPWFGNMLKFRQLWVWEQEREFAHRSPRSNCKVQPPKFITKVHNKFSTLEC